MRFARNGTEPHPVKTVNAPGRRVDGRTKSNGRQETLAMRMSMGSTDGTVATTRLSEIDALKCPPTGAPKNWVTPCDGGLPCGTLQEVVRDCLSDFRA